MHCLPHCSTCNFVLNRNFALVFSRFFFSVFFFYLGTMTFKPWAIEPIDRKKNVRPTRLTIIQQNLQLNYHNEWDNFICQFCMFFQKRKNICGEFHDKWYLIHHLRFAYVNESAPYEIRSFITFIKMNHFIHWFTCSSSVVRFFFSFGLNEQTEMNA